MKRDDSLWKAILEDVFDDFLRFFIPGVDDLFDLSRGIVYLDKELEQLYPPEGDDHKVRYVDKLAKVHTRGGSEKWILVHVEVQGYRDTYFSKRMFQYYTRIWDKYDRPIVSFAIFTDSVRKYRPSIYEESFLGTSICYKFNTYKVADQDEVALRESANPFALVVLAAKTALQKRSGMRDPELYQLKIGIVRLLKAKQLDDRRIRKIMNFLRNYVSFENPEMSHNFDKEVAVITQNRSYMGTEEYLLQKARKEALQEALQEAEERAIQREKELIRNLISKAQCSPEQIAEIFNVPVALVLSIKKDVEGK